ncbi:zinc finger protein 577-like [Mercenaria mercenaria]|uniref:zinc finger protein 577-like n=1 Tax=Mercenaria mercenaria TaxID=6596 RepID=UPI00234F7A1F|nr:zinc finger protein 577-like [Mercenaria mercenaria]
MKFCCPKCDYKTDKKSELLKHQRSANHWEKFNCNICGKVFTRKDNLDKHVYKHRNENSFHCSECGCAFSREDNLFRHLRDKHQVGGGRKREGSSTSEASAPKLRKLTYAWEYYNLRKVNARIIKKFRTKSSTYKASFKNLEVVELQDILTTLQALFSSILNEVTKGSKSNDLVRIVVQSPTLDYPIVIPFGPVTVLTADRFLQEVERVLQSNEDFLINESLEFEITLVDMPSGGTRKRFKFVNNDRFLLEKKCIIRIKNSDNLCCARARIDKHEKWEGLRKGYEPQGDLARALHKAASVKEGQCGIEESYKFKQY